jgi:hypothetical protein
MIDKPATDINPEDLRRLQANGVPESRSLDYKQALPGGTDDERKEFLADVSSLANTVGGDLIYGVKEVRENGRQTGIPECIDGLAGAVADAETLRLENMLRDGVAPRLSGVQLRWVPGFPLGSVLIIRVPRSWAGPHMVTYKQHSRFYARNAGGKYALDVFELRQAFLGSGSLRERAREFRAERLGRVVAGETPLPLTGSSLVCLHVIPHATLAGAVDVDLQLAANQRESLQPMYSRGWSSIFNLDGFTTYCPTATGPSISYLQVFRTGAIETVSSALISSPREDQRRHLPCLAFADELNAVLGRIRRLMTVLAIDPPASLLVSLLGVRGVHLGVSTQLTFHRDIHGTPFDRDNLLFRDLLLASWDGDDQRVVLKPLLDEVWQAAGFARCFDYDDQGAWRPLP